MLRVRCEAALDPDNSATQAWAKENVSWAAGDISGSTKAWVDEAGTAADNKGKVVVCQFTSLPTTNAAFGTKTVTMTVTGNAAGTSRNIEVFFDREAINHPGGDQTRAGRPSTRSPNWFYYWNPVVGDSDAFFDSGLNQMGAAGLTPAMYYWNVYGYSALPYSKTEIWLGPDSGTQTYAAGVSTYHLVTGIDCFANTIVHENYHVTQIAQADAVLGGLNGKPFTVWRYGWSWAATTNNHWTLGTDGKTGRANIDDDANGRIDNELDLTELGAAGSDDVDLDVNNDDIPDSWGPQPPAPVWAGILHPAEGAAYQSSNIPQNTNWQSDWGSAGKRHRTNQDPSWPQD